MIGYTNFNKFMEAMMQDCCECESPDKMVLKDGKLIDEEQIAQFDFCKCECHKALKDGDTMRFKLPEVEHE